MYAQFFQNVVALRAEGHTKGNMDIEHMRLYRVISRSEKIGKEELRIQ